MGYKGQTHVIDCSKGGFDANPNIDNIPATQMISPSKNVEYKRGGRGKRGGSSRITGLIADSPRIMGIFDFMPPAGSQFIVFATDDGKIYKNSSTPIKTGLTVDKLTDFSQLNSILIACNGADIPQSWDGSGSIADVGAGGIDIAGACTGALADPATPGNVEDGDHSYKITFVNPFGETSGGTTSNVVTVADKAVNGQVELTFIPVSDDSSVTSRKIYRTVAGDAGNHKLVATIGDNVTTTYTDNVADGSLGDDVPVTNTALAKPSDWVGSNYPAWAINHGRGASQRMHYGGCPSNPYEIYSSPNNDPLTMDDGSIILTTIDTGDGFGIVGGAVLKDRMVLFGRRRSYFFNDADTNTANWGFYEADWSGGAGNNNLIIRTPNDLVVMDESFNVYSLVAAEQLGDFKQASLSEPSFIGQWMRDNLAVAYIGDFHGIYNEEHRCVDFWVVRTGQTKVDTKLRYYIDRAPAEAWTIIDNQLTQGFSGEQASCAATIRVGPGVYEIYTGDYTGYIWKIEQAARSDHTYVIDYTFTTPDMDMTEVLGPIAPRLLKRFERLWLEVDPKGSEVYTISWWIDGAAQDDLTITVSGSTRKYSVQLGAVGKSIRYKIRNNSTADCLISRIFTDFMPLGGLPE